MKIDSCLILAAGFGTRMGEVGTILPKVLWPVFSKPMLGIQIDYAKSLGIKKIYINIHHQADIISNYLLRNYSEDVIILHETPEILDIGGAVHNLAKKIGYQGNLLILNSDQFLFFDKTYFTDALNEFVATLFLIKVKKNEKYNETVVDENNFLTKITQNKDVILEEFWTYSGNSIINLDKLTPMIGVLNFFNSVANFKDIKIKTIKLDKVNYWDFGTKLRYTQSLFKIIQTINPLKNVDLFLHFLMENSILIYEKINKEIVSYNSDEPLTINFSNSIVNQPISKYSVILDNVKKVTGAGVYYSDKESLFSEEELSSLMHSVGQISTQRVQ